MSLDRPLIADDGDHDEPIAAPVHGELVESSLVAVTPSPAEQNTAADRARGRTTQQVGMPSALVVIGAWIARLLDVDLNPLDGSEDMPPEVVAAFIAVVTVVTAIRMNPKQ